MAEMKFIKIVIGGDLYTVRIVSGIARGFRLESIVQNNIRPTSDKVKESIFNIIQFKIKDKSFLDLFGGTGQIGIEAASRGAKKVTIVDNNKESIGVIRRNVSKLKYNFNISIIESDSVEFLKNSFNKMDIAFLDPPYGSKVLDESLECISNLINEKGMIILETSSGTTTVHKIGRFNISKQYKYGSIMVSTYED